MTDTELLDWLENNGYGYALVSDDAGRWACICDGVQDVSLTMEEEAFDCATSFWIEKARWKSSTREAILDAMKEAEADGN